MDATAPPSTTCPTCNHSLTESDHKLHPLLCALFSSPPPKPPSPSILGLLFPTSSPSTVSSTSSAPSPTPVWIPLTTTTDEETSVSFQSVSTASVFPSSSTSPAPDVLYTERNTRRNKDTRSMLEIWTVEWEGRENETIKRLAEDVLSEGETTGPYHAWTGPVLALAMTRATGFMVDPGMYRDVTVEDAADVVDFLVDYENPEHGRRIREALDMLGAGRVEEAGDEGGDRDDDAKETTAAAGRDEGSIAAGEEGNAEPVVFEVL